MDESPVTHATHRQYRQNGLVAICLLIVAQFSQAQPTSGAIVGLVLDSSRARVAGATVTARNQATGLVHSAVTGALGEYTLATLPPGVYAVAVSKDGFGEQRRTGVEVMLDQKFRLDFEMKPGAVATAVEVSAPENPLQTRSAETGEVISAEQIAALPLLGRNFLELTWLTAGAARSSGGNVLNLSANGQREFANSVLIDGLESTSNRNNDAALRPPLAAVEEFKVLTGSYGAEFGRASGAVVAIQTRSGSNQLHGEAFEYFRPSATTAKNFFASERSGLRQHNAGGSIGAPLRRDHTFVFASFEGMRLRDSFSYLDSVPPASQIRLSGGGADLSGLTDPFTGKQVPIFDPAFYAQNYYSSQFPGNVIPANRLSAAGKAVLQNFFPAPSLPGAYNGWFNNYLSRQAYSYDSTATSARFDHSFSPSQRFSAVYHINQFDSLSGDRFAGRIPVDGGGDADYGDHENVRSQSVSVSHTSVLSARWLNEASFGYSRSRLDQLGLLDGRPLATQYGVGNVNYADDASSMGFPSIYLGFGAQTGGSTWKPLRFLDGNYGAADQVSAHLSRHDVKVGAGFRLLRSRPLFSLFPTGFQYYGGPGVSLTSDPNYGFFDASAFYYNGGSDIADLLLGLPYSVDIGRQLTNPQTRSTETFAFVEDSWQATSRLSVTTGLRYEYAAPWTEVENRASNLDMASGRVALAGMGGNSAALVRADRNNFAPRLGMAYRLGGRTVVRAGWGMYYSPENDGREDLLTKNYPFAVQRTIVNDIYSGLPFAYTLDGGVARFSPPSPANGASSLDPAAIKSATGSKQNLYVVDQALRTGYSQMYNVTLQRQASAGVVVEAGFVGSVSRKLSYAVGDLNLCGRLNPALGQVQALYSEGSASYQSLQAKATKRFSSNLGFLAAYTFGRNIDNGPAPFNLGHNQNAQNWPQSAFDLGRERAVADSDAKHTLSLSVHYALPAGPGRRFLANRNNWAGWLLGGWELNGILAGRSGLPVNVVRNAQLTGYAGLRPDVVANPNLSGDARTLRRYFNTVAFSAARFSGAAKTGLGNAGRNLVRGPGLLNLDIAAVKVFAVARQLKLETRVELFNACNTPHFANPNGNMAAGNFGSITQTKGNARVAQFAAKLKW